MNQTTALQTDLLTWFQANGRDLPWRRTRNPYYILVSETMLQQTQVDRVIPKYEAFLALFPTVEALASASTADVIRSWQGLGYNRRAVNLQRAAQAIVAAGYPADSAGFPDTPEGLRNLPGIGAYTSGAVACFAFERDVAFLDTNIRRVVRRLLVGPEDAPPATNEQTLIDYAQQLIPKSQGWAWNQAIMELGALICTAAKPQCWRCPVNQHCRAYAIWREANTQLDMWQPPVIKLRKKAAEQPFHSSNRYFRGRIIDALRALEAQQSLDLASLGPQVQPEWLGNEADLTWLAKLVAGLAQDGLLIWQQQPEQDLAGWSVRLPA